MASIYSVTQVNSYIKNMFKNDFALRRISVRGEVSNCKYHTSGHIYFTLKDKTGTLAAVMFAGQRKGLTFQIQEGQQVVVSGAVDVYERDGKYQLYASQIELDGRGDLYERFLELRNELEEMGMFAPEYKQEIPRYAARIGIVTASTGAAIRDIMNIAQRRNPYVQLILYPALVQGEQAAASIVKGIKTLDAMGKESLPHLRSAESKESPAEGVDVLIVGRGGGSIEDLWAFNEEMVARAIFECETPVISAVGHETDVTIADYVADLRAPTPSAAAELAVFDYRHFEDQLLSYRYGLNRAMDQRLERLRYQLNEYLYQLRLHDPIRQIRDQRQRLADMEERMQSVMERKILDRRHRLALLSGHLHGLSPLEKISRGFGFLTNETGSRVAGIADVKKDETMTVRVSDGMIRTQVVDTEKII